jgi:hypothetical protein
MAKPFFLVNSFKQDEIDKFSLLIRPTGNPESGQHMDGKKGFPKILSIRCKKCYCTIFFITIQLLR